MDKLDVVDSFGTVPFLDYKHFALRTFFPEVRSIDHTVKVECPITTEVLAAVTKGVFASRPLQLMCLVRSDGLRWSTAEAGG